MVIQDLEALLLHELHLAEDAEEQLREALPRLEAAIPNPRLQRLLRQRLCEGARVFSDIRSCLERHSEQDGRARNASVAALLQEAERSIAAAATADLKQLTAVSALRRLQHQCLAGWSSLHLLAARLGDEAAMEHLASALEEGQRWDRQFGDLALKAKDPAAEG